jgi:hypothetical protein
MLSEYDKAWCNKLLTELTKWPITAPFRMPVDPVRDGAANYRQIISNPMDFHTMKKKLTGSEYTSVQSFIDDIQLICDNAKKFNGAQSMFGLIGDDIMEEVHKQFSEKAATADEEWYKSLVKAVQALHEHVHQAPPEVSMLLSNQKLPDFSKIGLTPEQISIIEKETGESVQNLPLRWPFLNEASRGNIISIVGENSNK